MRLVTVFRMAIYNGLMKFSKVVDKIQNAAR